MAVVASGGHRGPGRGRPGLLPPPRSEASLCCSELPRPARPPPLSAAAGRPRDGPGPVPRGDLCRGFPYFLRGVRHWGCWCSPHREGGKGTARGPCGDRAPACARVLLSGTRHLPWLGWNRRSAGHRPVPAPPEGLAVLGLGREPGPGSAGSPLPQSQVAPQVSARRDLAGSSRGEERLVGASHPPVAWRGRLAGGHDVLPGSCVPGPAPGGIRERPAEATVSRGFLGVASPVPSCPPAHGVGVAGHLPLPGGRRDTRVRGQRRQGHPRQVTWENVPTAATGGGGGGTAGRPRLAGHERAVGTSGARAGQGTSAVCGHRTTTWGSRHQRGGRGSPARL